MRKFYKIPNIFKQVLEKVPLLFCDKVVMNFSKWNQKLIIAKNRKADSIGEESIINIIYMCLFQLPAQTLAAPMPTSLPPPIRMRVRVQEDVFLIPVLQRLVSVCISQNECLA